MLCVPETAFVYICSVLDVCLKTVLQFVLLLEKPRFTFLGAVILRHFGLLIHSLCVCLSKLFLNESLSIRNQINAVVRINIEFVFSTGLITRNSSTTPRSVWCHVVGAWAPFAS